MEAGPHRIYFGDAGNLAPILMGVADTDGDAAILAEEARAVAKSPNGLDAMFQQGDTDGDGKLNTDEVKAMIGAKPELYSSGLLRPDGESSAAHIALRGLLLASLDKVSEAFKARLESPRVQITA
jgi:hypothetical protein